ncbi:hypothetical protein Droror1_Dr00024568 [Drosera rotundifolia]
MTLSSQYDSGRRENPNEVVREGPDADDTQKLENVQQRAQGSELLMAKLCGVISAALTVKDSAVPSCVARFS